MIHIIQGDLLASDCTVIAHQCNCFSTMGAGIAKQIAEKYPQALQADKNFPYPPEERLGKISIAYNDQQPLVIYNLYAQYRYEPGKRHTDYAALKSALNMMFANIRVNRYALFQFPIKIGLPFGMGAGLAGGDWDIIYAIIDDMALKYETDVYLYRLH